MLYQTQTYNPSAFFIKTCAGQPESGKKIVQTFTSVDPLADKRPGESPYSYCGNNPMNRVDPTGMIWDDTQLTPSQKQNWDKLVDDYRNNSPLFDKMYDEIEQDPETYSVKIGKTKNGTPGEFDPTNKTITYQDENTMGATSTFFEEIFHAYQNKNEGFYTKGKDFNIEFEAKIVSYLIYGQHPVSQYGFSEGLFGMTDYLNDKFGFGNSPSKEDVNSIEFQSIYLYNANVYSNYNQKNNIGNKHYKMGTIQSPKSLMNLISK